jgi:hypothetical protein
VFACLTSKQIVTDVTQSLTANGYSRYLPPTASLCRSRSPPALPPVFFQFRFRFQCRTTSALQRQHQTPCQTPCRSTAFTPAVRSKGNSEY